MFKYGKEEEIMDKKMRVVLVVYELSINSFDHGTVYGEEMDAWGIQKAFQRRADVESCDILTINLIRYLEQRGEMKEYDLAIHFAVPTVKLKNAINVLFFQQFYEWEKHDMTKHLENFDYVITPAQRVTEWYKDVIYFPLAVDMDFYKPVAKDIRFMDDIVFVGNRRMRDIETYDRFLKPAFGHKLAIYGAEWDVPGFEAYQKYNKGMLPYDDAAKVYSSVRISLCIHNKEYVDKFLLVTTRGFHSISCGGFVISDSISEMMKLLPEGKGVIYTDGYDDLKNKIDYYLKHDDERADISKAGYEWISKYHTWDVRVDKLLNDIKFNA